MRRFAFVLGVVVSALMLTAAPARAHATLQSSEPAAGSQVDRAPAAVTLNFSEQPDVAASDIRVIDTSGRLVSTGRVQATSRLTLRVTLGSLSKGVYTVTWRVLSRVDGHVTGGSFAFGVGVSPEGVVLPPDETPESPGPSPFGVAGRWLLYAGVALLIGSAWVAAFTHRAPPRATGSLLWVGWSAAVLGVAGIAQAQRASAGVDIGDVFKTSIGSLLAARAVPLGVILVILFVVKAQRARAIGAGIGAAGAIVAHVAYGHAAAGSARALQVSVQAVHFTAAAVWIGGLAMLLVSMRMAGAEERARAVRRYSAAALWAVVVLAAAGSVRAFVEVRHLRSLWSTSFGVIVLVKLGLLGILVALGAINRYRMLPRAGEDPRGLTRVARVELTLAAAVLAATGVLTSVAPARYAAPVAARAGLTAEGSDLGTTVRATLSVTPGTPGPNSFELRVRDYDSDEPVRADAVSVRFRLVGEDVEPSTLTLEASGEGEYSARGANLAVPGPWVATVLVRMGTDSVEVPLALLPRAPQPESVIPGDPTLHDITLPDGRRVQMYVDPARAGRAEVHATFFDTGGKEFRGLGPIVLIGTPAGGMPQVLGSRLLSPGHAVANTRLDARRWRFDASTTTKDGARLWGAFEVTITS